MSAPVGWIGIQGMESERILDVVGLARAYPGKRLTGTMWTLPNGWTFVYTFDFGFPTPERMTALSAEGEAVALSVDDRVMFSVVRRYERGSAVFAIEHDGGEQGVRHMATAGTLPAEWQPILDRLSAQQDEEDKGDAMVDFLFDAPLELADALCGFRHDRAWPKGQEPIEIPLVEIKSAASAHLPKKPGLLSRLFGR